MLFGIFWFVRQIQKNEEGYLQLSQARFRAGNQQRTSDQQVVNIINLHNPKLAISPNASKYCQHVTPPNLRCNIGHQCYLVPLDLLDWNCWILVLFGLKLGLSQNMRIYCSPVYVFTGGAFVKRRTKKMLKQL